MLLRELYQDMIIDHGKTPRNFGKLDQANLQQEGCNPLCGDQLHLYILAENGIVKDVKFEGSGCAISMASASLLTESIKGKNTTEIEKLFNEFQRLVKEGYAEIDLGKLMVFSGVTEFPARVKCAILAWHTLKAALSNEQQVVSTE